MLSRQGLNGTDVKIKKMQIRVAVRGFVLSLVMAIALGFGGLTANAAGLTFSDARPLLGYSLDYDMDRATGDKTIEYYGEPVRDAVEQAMRNNVNHPERKETAQNSYGRKSFLNDLLPDRNSKEKRFSQDDFSKMRKTANPNDRLKK